MLKKAILLLMLLSLFVEAADRAGIPIEKIDFPIPDIVSFPGSETAPLVGHYDGWYAFTVYRGEREYSVLGCPAFMKMKEEFARLDQLEKSPAGSFFLSGITDAVRSSGKGLGSTVIHPVRSVKNIWSAGTSFFNKTKEEGLVDAWMDDSPERRNVAAKLGFDYYSTNPEVQRFLSEAASRMKAGKLAIGALALAVPVPGAGLTLSAGRLNRPCEELLGGLSPSELTRRVQDEFRSMGIAEEQVAAVVEHAYVSPRNLVYFCSYIRTLQHVTGAGFLPFEAIRSADSQLEVDAVMQQLEWYTRLHKTQNIAELFRVDGLLGCLLSKNYQHLVIVPYDYFELTVVSRKMLGQLRDKSLTSPEIWVSGKIDADAKAYMSSNGIAFEERVLQEAVFSALTDGTRTGGL